MLSRNTQAILVSVFICPGYGHYILGDKKRASYLLMTATASMLLWTGMVFYIAYKQLSVMPITQMLTSHEFYQQSMLIAQDQEQLIPVLCITLFSIIWLYAIIDCYRLVRTRSRLKD